MLSNNATPPREGAAPSHELDPVPLTSTEMRNFTDAPRAPRNARAADVVVEGGGNNDDASVNAPTHPDGDATVNVSSANADDPFDVRTRPQRRRTMGEVYPIMKNTIYSDDECEEEVALTAWDCGAHFIRYVNGLFQYLVRNPKVMGLIFTTLILLLFFKYSQQQVVKVVNAAVKAHPGLEPTDTLRSAVVTFTDELRALERVAQTLGWAYQRDSVVGYDINTAISTTFFALVNSFQTTFSSNIKTYVVYALPNAASTTVTDVLSAHWGQIGCATESSKNPMCYYITSGSVAREWVVSSGDSDMPADDEGNETAEGVYVEERMPELLSVVATATKGSTLASTGVWTRPSLTQRIFSDASVRTISYLIPITFNAEGQATALAGVDVSVQVLMDIVNVSSTPNIEMVVVDNRYNADQGGQFVYDTFNDSLFWPTPYGVLNTPVSRVNALAEPIYRNNGNTLAANASFFQNGLIYQSLTMMDHWTLIASSPLALSVAEVVASLGSIVKETQSISETASSLYQNCEVAANTQADSMPVAAFAQIEHAFGTQLHSLYVSYTLSGIAQQSSSSSSSSSSSTSSSSSSEATGQSSSNTTSAGDPATSTTSSTSSSTTTSTTSSSTTTATEASASTATNPEAPSEDAATSAASPGETGDDLAALRALAASANEAVNTALASSSTSAAASRKWGVCGCTFSSSSSETTCFYTDSHQQETIFQGSVLSESPANATRTQDYALSRRYNFTEEYIDNSNVTEGFWTVPYASHDTVTGETFVAVSYVHPSTHDSTGIVSRASVVDTTAHWIMQSLKANQHNGTTGLYLIDRRDAGIFIASSTQAAAVTGVYPALSTPYPEFNKIAEAVYTMSGNSWGTSLSFHQDGMLVNYQVVLGQWGVIEVMPGETALQRYLPTPAVDGATDAIRLLPLGQTVELFLYVSGILLLYFLNLLILGCSKLGEK